MYSCTPLRFLQVGFLAGRRRGRGADEEARRRGLAASYTQAPSPRIRDPLWHAMFLRRSSSSGRPESTPTGARSNGEAHVNQCGAAATPSADAKGTQAGLALTGPTSASKGPSRPSGWQKLRSLRKVLPVIVSPPVTEAKPALRVTGRWNRPDDPSPATSPVPTPPKLVRFTGVQTTAMEQKKLAAMAERREKQRAARARAAAAPAGAASAAAASAAAAPIAAAPMAAAPTTAAATAAAPAAAAPAASELRAGQPGVGGSQQEQSPGDRTERGKDER